MPGASARLAEQYEKILDLYVEIPVHDLAVLMYQAI